MTEARSDLIHVTVDGVEYVGIRRDLAGAVGKCVEDRLTALASATGSDVPRHLPLWATGLQLIVEGRLTAGSANGSSVDSGPAPASLSVHDVAKQLGISTRAVRAAAAGERLVGRQLGRFWTFRQSDVDDFSNRRTSA